MRWPTTPEYRLLGSCDDNDDADADGAAHGDADGGAGPGADECYAGDMCVGTDPDNDAAVRNASCEEAVKVIIMGVLEGHDASHLSFHFGMGSLA